jgi:hypothetical protein
MGPFLDLAGFIKHRPASIDFKAGDFTIWFFSAPTFLFLPEVLLLTALAPARARNFLLLLASLFFYAWGEMLYVGVMLASIAEIMASAAGSAAPPTPHNARSS